MRPLLGVIALVSALLAQSQPPSPTPGEISTEKQGQRQAKKSQAEMRDQIPQPLVNQHIGQGEDGKLDNSKNKSDDNSPVKYTIDFLLMLATVVLAGATIALYKVAKLQLSTMKEHKQSFETIATALVTGLEQTKNAADAATASAQAVINGQRAWVVVSDIQQGPLRSLPESTFVFRFTNRGRTVARTTGPFRFRFAVTPLEPLPEAPDYGNAPPEGVAPIHGTVLIPNESIGPISLQCWEPMLDDGTTEKIAQRKATLYFYASLLYYDSFNILRELQFCYQYFPSSSNTKSEWRVSGPDAYNKHT